MANLYWVGGTGDWSDDDNHWATSSGGSPSDGNLPTAEDDVFIDANSGFGSGGTITIGSENAYMANFTSNSEHTYSIASDGYYFLIYGSIIFEGGLTIEDTVAGVGLSATSGNQTIKINGCTINSYNFYVGDDTTDAATWTLQDDLTIAGHFQHSGGTFDANDHNVTANDFYFYADTGYTPTVILGRGNWTPAQSEWTIDENNDEVVRFICVLNQSLSELEHDWYATRSGLAGNAPLGDHKRAYFDSKGFGGNSKPLSQCEEEWLLSVGGRSAEGPYDLWSAACEAQSVTVGKSVDECKFNFFSTVASGTNP